MVAALIGVIVHLITIARVIHGPAPQGKTFTRLRVGQAGRRAHRFYNRDRGNADTVLLDLPPAKIFLCSKWIPQAGLAASLLLLVVGSLPLS